jgi:hypothetical protein
MTTSIMSFPDRGKWGKSSWRGNCSGHVYKALFEQYKPQTFVDPMMGSGTSIEVAREMNIESYGLDLHSGFNILRDSILERVGKEVDLVFSHPPYSSMIVYSGEVWGDEPHPDDLSRCLNDEDFHEKMHIALLNQRAATKPGGMYGMLIGDLRSNGHYVSYQAEAIARLPANELAAVIIKSQHNCVSDSRSYKQLKHPRIMHEYILLWQKPKVMLAFLTDLAVMAKQNAVRLKATWKAIVYQAMIQLGGKARLQDLYRVIADGAPEKLKGNPHWQDKVRQVLQLDRAFGSTERGVWQIVGGQA